MAMLGCTLTARGGNLVELNDNADWLGSGTWRLTDEAVGLWRVDAAGVKLFPGSHKSAKYHGGTSEPEAVSASSVSPPRQALKSELEI
eukprot:scaffold5848_cov33-Phaeocystis_antarctica.AAC.2